MWWSPSWFSIEQIFLAIKPVKLCRPPPKLHDSIFEGGASNSQYSLSLILPIITAKLKYIPTLLAYEFNEWSFFCLNINNFLIMIISLISWVLYWMRCHRLYRGAACTACNLKMRVHPEMNIYCHNLKGKQL